MKDKKNKPTDENSEAFFDVEEGIWDDDGDDGRKKRNSGKRRHRINDSDEHSEHGDAHTRRGSRWS